MVVEKKNIAVYVLLSIITCGIFAIVWAIHLARDAVHIKDENDDGTLEIVLMIFLPFLGFFFAEKKFAEGCAARGIAHNDNSIVYLILGLVGLGIVNYCLMQNELNKLADMGI